jgi:hypothetical protein
MYPLGNSVMTPVLRLRLRLAMAQKLSVTSNPPESRGDRMARGQSPSYRF